MLAKDVMSESYAVLKESDKLTKAIAMFEEKEPDVVVVFDDEGNYKGVLSERWIYRSRLDPTKTKVRALTRFVSKAHENDELVSVAKKMLESNTQAVPVFSRKNTLVGVVTDMDLLVKVVESEFGNMDAIQFATTNLMVLLPNDTVGKALALFRYNGISRAPVIDGGKVIGIVTMHDIVTRFVMPRDRMKYGEVVGEKIRPLSTPVSRIMSSPVISIKPDGKLRDAVKLMKEHEISGVMILDDKGKGVGIITKKDLIEALVRYSQTSKRRIGVQFAGDYEDIDEFDLEKIRRDIENFANKMEKMFDEGLITVHFKKIKNTRRESRRYLIRLRLAVPGRTYNSHHEGFNALEVMQVALDKLEDEVFSDKKRRIDSKREAEFLEKYELWL